MSVSTPENKVKRKIDTMLKSLGAWYFSPNAGPYGKAGIPDRIICIKGFFVGIEAKANRAKKPTALQNRCMTEIEEAGGKCFVVYDDATLAEARTFIHNKTQELKHDTFTKRTTNNIKTKK